MLICMQKQRKKAEKSTVSRESAAPESVARFKHVAQPTDPAADRGASPQRKSQGVAPASEQQMELASEFDGGQLPPVPRQTSGTLADLADSGQLSVNDSGLSLEPEQLGKQFLRDATEQDNFESEVTEDEELEPGDAALGQMISEGTLDAAGQGGLDIPESEALHTRSAAGSVEGDLEPSAAQIDLMSSSTSEDSLFDEPLDAEDDQALLAPEIDADEVDADDTGRTPTGANEEAHAQEVRRLREQLRQNRDGSAARSDKATWDANRRTGRSDAAGPDSDEVHSTKG
jgi:hypothetical protein